MSGGFSCVLSGIPGAGVGPRGVSTGVSVGIVVGMKTSVVMYIHDANTL